MKFKGINVDVGDFVLIIQKYDFETGKELKPKRRYIGIVRNIEDWNGDKLITITNKDLKYYQEEIKGFKDLFLTCKLWRNIRRSSFGNWSSEFFQEKSLEKIKILK